MRFTKLVFTIWLILPLTVVAQFEGGFGDGFQSGQISCFLNGALLNSFLSGGIGDGFSRTANSSFLTGGQLSAIYNGSTGDGFDYHDASAFLNGNGTSLLYDGGISDGFNNAGNSSFLDGELLSQVFSGGVSDGFDQSAFTAFLDGAVLAFYDGGSGDGFANNVSASMINGLQFGAFAGGNGDGFSSSGTFIISSSLAYALWTGISNIDWQTPTNWYRNYVPTNADDVVIDGLPVNQPSIGTNVIVENLTIQSGAEVEVQAANSLTVNGDLSIADIDGLILRSDASATGYSQLLAKGQVLGAGTVKGEFYVGNTAGFRHLSSPFLTSFNDLKVGPNLLIAANSASGNLFYWNANTALWAAPNSVTSLFNSGKGYAVYMGTNQFGTYVSSLPALLDLSGPLHSTANVIVNLAYNSGQSSPFFASGTSQAQTEGWNLIGNPYPCAYDWDFQKFKPEMTNEGYAVWDPLNDRYAYYNNGTSTNGASRYISPYQGIFVQTKGVSTFTFFQDSRTVLSNPQLFKTDPEDLKLIVANSGGDQTDELILGFIEDATDGFDGDWDVWKFPNGKNASSFYTMLGNETYAINRMANFEVHKAVRIGYGNTSIGTYNISSDLSAIDKEYAIELEDLSLHKLHNLRNGPYNFVHEGGNSGRFILHINKNGDLIGDKAGNPEELVFITSSSRGIIIDFSLALSGDKEISIHDLIGRSFATSKVEEGEAKIEINFNLNQSTYVVVQIIGEGWVLNKKVFIDH